MALMPPTAAAVSPAHVDVQHTTLPRDTLIVFDIQRGLEPSPALLSAELEQRGGAQAAAAWARAQDALKQGLQGFYGDGCISTFQCICCFWVCCCPCLPWVCWAQARRQRFIRQWVADVNAAVFEPHGLYAKFQCHLGHAGHPDDEHDAGQPTRRWLTVALTPEGADDLRGEPAFVWFGKPDLFACCYCYCCQPKVV